MKIAARVFAIIGKVTAIISIVGCVIGIVAFFTSFFGIDGSTEEQVAAQAILIVCLIESIITLPFSIASLIFVKKVLKSLQDNEQKVWLGVVALIFINVLCGIFYLCWRPEKKIDDIEVEVIDNNY
ncbi:MAG: hypothetical protein PUA56_02680 [Bacillales bacterium]|nr:hypothetical protein [Bacillales bacterium]